MKINCKHLLNHSLLSLGLLTLFGIMEGAVESNPFNRPLFNKKYIITTWGLFIPAILSLYPLAYYFATKDKQTTKKLAMITIGMLIFSAFYQDWIVFLSSKKSLKGIGSVFESAGLPNLKYGNWVFPAVYPIAGVLGVGLILYASRGCWK